MKRQTGFQSDLHKRFSLQSFIDFSGSGLVLCCSVCMFLLILLAGCSKQQDIQTNEPSAKKTEPSLNSNDEFVAAYNTGSTIGNNETAARSRVSLTTILELLQARAATAKYRDFDRAVADSFVEINVVVPNMGYHFMKSAIVDSVFEINRPEILVYNKRADGKFELLAVEYAVPISATPEKAPEGFTGSADVWERNTDFGLWLQHAWLWKFNPDGVFHDTNPLVTVH